MRRYVHLAAVMVPAAAFGRTTDDALSGNFPEADFRTAMKTK
jgi:hypothetical protein